MLGAYAQATPPGGMTLWVLPRANFSWGPRLELSTSVLQKWEDQKMKSVTVKL
jgi:hypothetical protein